MRELAVSKDDALWDYLKHYQSTQGYPNYCPVCGDKDGNNFSCKYCPDAREEGRKWYEDIWRRTVAAQQK
jgi:hypothetical protein